jgi:hypothetical protein
MTQQDLYSRDFAVAQAAGEKLARATRRNVELFTQMFLGLGADCLKITGTAHDAELAEARGLAAWRWNQLLGMEEQIGREEQQLALRPKKRPTQPGDEVLPDRTLAQRDAGWLDETKYKHVTLADLKEQAKRARAELESFVTKRR